MNRIRGDAAEASQIAMKQETVSAPRIDCSFVVVAGVDSKTVTVLLSLLSVGAIICLLDDLYRLSASISVRVQSSEQISFKLPIFYQGFTFSISLFIGDIS